MYPYILKTNSVSLFPANQAPILIDSGHANFKAIVEALRNRDFDGALELAVVRNYLQRVTGGDVSVNADGVTYKGKPVSGYLSNKLQQFFADGLPVEHYCLFLHNLMANPSMVSRNELFLFLEAADLPITEDGCFLAYKAVRSDFKDKHSGCFDNSPGITHAMPRAEVNDDRNQTCSYGFHAAAYEYAKHFMSGGDKLVAVKINPADVVSVPSDYNNQKLRTCKYSVEFEIPDAADVFKGRSYYTDIASDYTFDEDTETYIWDSVFDEDGDD